MRIYISIVYVYVSQSHEKWEDIGDEDGETADVVDKHITELYRDDEHCELVKSQEIQNKTLNRNMELTDKQTEASEDGDSCEPTHFLKLKPTFPEVVGLEEKR